MLLKELAALVPEEQYLQTYVSEGDFGYIGDELVWVAWMSAGGWLHINVCEGVRSVEPARVLVVVNERGAKTRHDVLKTVAAFVRASVIFAHHTLLNRTLPRVYARWFLDEGFDTEHGMDSYEVEVAELACEMIVSADELNGVDENRVVLPYQYGKVYRQFALE